GIRIRYGCHWESTRQDKQEFILGTSDGDYRAPVVVFAVGVAHPYRPPIPGLDQVPHYGDFRPVESYKDHRVFIVGKQNSGFEIAATGFVSPLRDLPALGVATFGQSHLPAQTPFWESATVPGLFFAGTLNQGSPGLKKHGIPSNSGAVQGYRYNARVLARHLAETRFGVRIPRPQLQPAETVRFLLNELSHGPELWHQRSYLARVVHLDRERGISDEGILPLSYFIDAGGPDAVAVALESNGQGDPYPAVYLRNNGVVSERLLPPHPLLDFAGTDYQRQLGEILDPVLSASPSPA